MTDVALNNPTVTAVQAVKSGNDIVAVGVGNPLPTAQTSSQTDRCIILETDFIAHSYNVAAGGVGNYSKSQIWNPVGSGKKIVVYTILTWHTSGTLQYQTVLTSTKLSTALGVTVQNICGGSTKTPVAELYKQNDQTTTSTLFTSKTSHATVAQNGTSGNLLAVIGVIKAGMGMNVELLTANSAFNGVFGWAEVDDIVS